MKIGVVGNGFVGHAMTLLRPHVEVLVWDVVPDKRDPKTLDIETFVDESEIIFWNFIEWRYGFNINSFITRGFRFSSSM